MTRRTGADGSTAPSPKHRRGKPPAHTVALLSRRLELVHEYRPGRSIVTTALVCELVWVAADRRLLGYRQLRTSAN